MGFDIIEQLQGRVVRVPAAMGGRAEVEIDAAGKGPDAVDAAVFT
jgi:hypothetical protein